jgi:sulfoxide reductase catalytic subunit YedY
LVKDVPHFVLHCYLPIDRATGYDMASVREGRKTMNSRRRFLTLACGSFLGAGFLLGPLASAMQWAWAAGRKVLAKGTRRESLIHENPAALDTTNLELTPLEDFGTMGPTDEVVDPATWRLEVSGHVKRALSLNYSQLTALPSIERKVLLICPGFFANHGRWKGVSITRLLEQADFDRTATQVVIAEKGAKTARYPLADILSDKVFLAYQVNGKALPRKHGFPLRVVAEDYYGSDWVKYVDTITVERA